MDPLTTRRVLKNMINDMLFVRRNKRNYDLDPKDRSFAENHGAKGYHGSHGPITSSQPKYNPHVWIAAIEEANELNYPIVDINGKSQIGFYPLLATNKNCRSRIFAKRYLATADDRKNLDIVKQAYVTKIIFEGNRATIVKFLYPGETGKPYTIKARREVIVSAGAVNTPKMQMLSGIGPCEELEKHNIPVIADLPVGKNLHDHLNTFFNYDVSPKITSIVEKGFPGCSKLYFKPNWPIIEIPQRKTWNA